MTVTPESLFTAFSHATRMRCLLLLWQHDELCVCELTHAIGAAQPHLSRHLAHLREAELVVDRRQGLWIYYRINPQLPQWVTAVFQHVVEGNKENPPYSLDAEKLLNMPDRPAARCA